MTPVVLDIERPLVVDLDDTRGRTLDELLTGTSAALLSGRVIPCPVCGGEMAPDGGRETAARIGHCRACGSTLS
jgi:hypothetical protein